MRPKVVRIVIVNCFGEVEVLELGKSEKSWSHNDLDTEDLGKAMVVKVEGILESETTLLI